MKPISIEDRELIICRNSQIHNSEYQFSTLFIWQESFGFKYEVFNNTNGDLQCYFPLGPEEEFKGAVSRTIDIFHAENRPVNFRPLNEQMKDKLIEQLPFMHAVGSKESYSDYIYDYNEIRSYEGHEYKRKRKDWKAFNALYDYTYETITPNNFSECLNALQKMIMTNPKPDPEELRAYTRAFSNFDKLHLRGGTIRINGTIEAVAVGEAIGDMVLMHIRRANKQYRGIYPSVLRLILENEFNDCDYTIVNTQDDLGMPNIRKTKMSYNPIYLLKKYYVKEEKNE